MVAIAHPLCCKRWLWVRRKAKETPLLFALVRLPHLGWLRAMWASRRPAGLLPNNESPTECRGSASALADPHSAYWSCRRCQRRRRLRNPILLILIHPVPCRMAAALRQQVWGLARLAQRQSQALTLAGPACLQLQQAAGLHTSAERLAGGGGITGWLASKLPGMMGGGGQIDDLDLESE